MSVRNERSMDEPLLTTLDSSLKINIPTTMDNAQKRSSIEYFAGGDRSPGEGVMSFSLSSSTTSPRNLQLEKGMGIGLDDSQIPATVSNNYSYDESKRVLNENETGARRREGYSEGIKAILHRTPTLQQSYDVGHRGSVSDVKMYKTLEKERSIQEERNARVLALLQAKDEAIEDLEIRSANLASENIQLKSQLKNATHQLASSNERVKELEETVASHESKIYELQGDLDLVEEEAQRDRGAAEELGEMATELEAAKNQVSSLTAALETADEVMEQMQAQTKILESKDRQREDEFESLKSYVRHLLSISKENNDDAIESVMERGLIFSRMKDKITNLDGKDRTIRIDDIEVLERANKALETALLKSNIQRLGISLEDYESIDDAMQAWISQQGMNSNQDASGKFEGNSCANVPEEKYRDTNQSMEDADDIVKLSVEIAALKGELESIRERNKCLEEARALTQRAALHAEAQLQEVLEKEAQSSKTTSDLKEKLSATEAHLAEVEQELTEHLKSKAILEEELEQIKFKFENNTEAHVNQMKALSEQINSLESDKRNLELSVDENVQKLAEVQEKLGKERNDALQQADSALKQCNSLKTKFFDAQKENDEIKSLLADSEMKVAFLTAKESVTQSLALPETDGAEQVHYLSAFNPGFLNDSNDSNLGAVINEMGKEMQQSIAQHGELRKEIIQYSQRHVVDLQVIERLEKSVKRLEEALLPADAHKMLSNSTEDDVNEDKKACEKANHTEKAWLELTDEISRLNSQLEKAIVAQEGQATAFVSVTAAWREREESFKAIIKEEQEENNIIKSCLSRLESLCAHAANALQNALAHVAIAEGKDDNAEALLRAEVSCDDLEPVALEVTTRIKELAHIIARNRQENEEYDNKFSGMEVDKILAAQQHVIRSLAAHLSLSASTDFDSQNLDLNTSAVENYTDEIMQSIQQNFDSAPDINDNGVLHIGSQASNELVVHSADGLFSLLSFLAKDAYESIASNKDMNTAKKTMENIMATLLILQREIRKSQVDNPFGTDGISLQSIAGVEYPGENKQHGKLKDKNEMKTANEAAYGKQYLDLIENLASMKEQVELLTAANEAAQEGEAHAKESVVLLTEEIHRLKAQRMEEKSAHVGLIEELNDKLQEEMRQCHDLKLLMNKKEQTERNACESAILHQASKLQEEIRGAITAACKKESSIEEEKEGNSGNVPPAVAALLNGMETLLSEASLMEAKLQRLEAATCEMNHVNHETTGSWGQLASKLKFAKSIASSSQEYEDQIRTLSKRCSQFSKEIKVLKSENAQLKQQVRSIEIRHKEDMAKKMKELQEARNNLKLQEQASKRKEKQNRDGDFALVQARKDLKELQDQHSNVQAQYNKVRTKLRKSEAENENLRKAADSCEKLQQSLESAESSTRMLSKALQDADGKIMILNQQIDELQTESFKRQQEFDHEISAKNREIENLEQKHRDCMVKISELETSTKSLQELSQNLEKKVIDAQDREKMAVDAAEKARAVVFHDVAGRIVKAGEDLRGLQADIDAGFSSAGI